MQTNTRKLSASGLLCAMAYMVMLLSKVIPEVSGFLQFDAKDVIIVTGGFILGPAYALIMSVVVAVLELMTVSDTGPIGMVMNIISTVAFCWTAALVYSRSRNFKTAVLSLAIGTIALTAVMLLWNYYITPLYMKVPRETVAAMLTTVFLPFNLIKGLINSGLTLLLYRPLSKALSKTGLIKSYTASRQGKLLSPSVILGTAILVVCIPMLLKLMNII